MRAQISLPRMLADLHGWIQANDDASIEELDVIQKLRADS
jgi:hypothetical protein